MIRQYLKINMDYRIIQRAPKITQRKEEGISTWTIQSIRHQNQMIHRLQKNLFGGLE